MVRQMEGVNTGEREGGRRKDGVTVAQDETGSRVYGEESRSIDYSWRL